MRYSIRRRAADLIGAALLFLGFSSGSGEDESQVSVRVAGGTPLELPDAEQRTKVVGTSDADPYPVSISFQGEVTAASSLNIRVTDE